MKPISNEDVSQQLEAGKEEDACSLKKRKNSDDKTFDINKTVKRLRFFNMSPRPSVTRVAPAQDQISNISDIDNPTRERRSIEVDDPDFLVTKAEDADQGSVVEKLKLKTDVKENEALRWAGFCRINLVKRTGQRSYMMSMLLLPFLPIIALIVQYSLTLKDLLQYQFEVQDSWLKVDGATHLEKFITNLQRERSEVAFHIFTYGKQSLALNLSERFTITDDALEQMPWPTIITNPNDPGVPKNNIFKSKLRFQIRHGDFRERISQAEEDIMSILNWYNSADATFLYHLSTGIKTTNSSSVWRYMIAYTNLLRCIENLGIAGAYGIRYYGQGKITHDNYVQMIRHFTLVDEYLEQSKNYVPQIGKAYESIHKEKGHYQALSISRKNVLALVPQEPDTKEALSFYQALWKYTEDLRVVIEDLRLQIKQIVDEEMNAANQHMAFGVTSLVLVLMISPIIIFLVRSATATIQIFSFSLSKKALELKNEKGKVHSLLFETLPRVIALEYTQTSKRKKYAERFESVTIFYSDVVDFLQLCEDSTPMDVGVFLNAFCKMFDTRINKYEVFKLQSENDAYMVAAGVPLATAKNLGDTHASEIATMALDLMDGASCFVIPHKPKEQLRLRISVHSGPAVGGIQKVGDNLPRYRLFGSTLEIASRLNDIGKPMKIHISSETKQLLDSIGGFRIEYRGVFEIKSKYQQHVETFWLLEKDGKDGKNWDLESPPEENNKTNVFPDYLKDLICSAANVDKGHTNRMISIDSADYM